MANPLTGDFQALMQVSLRPLNGLLATLHQNGANSESPLRLLHSVRSRVGDQVPARPDLDSFSDWVLEYQRARALGPRVPTRNLLETTSPPGDAKRIRELFGDLENLPELEPLAVKGTATLQLSTIRLSAAQGSTSKVTVHAAVRARYAADAGTAPLPEFVFGEIHATYEIRRTTIAGKVRLDIRPSTLDNEIEFTPGPGSDLTAGEVAAVSREVRKLVRQGISLLPIDLPATFPFRDFMVLATEFDAVITVPLQLTGGLPLAGGLQSINRFFIGSSGFGVAVSDEHVQSLIDVEAIRASARRRIVLRIRLLGATFSVIYRLRFSFGPTLTFEAGAIEISGRVEVETSTRFAPEGFVSFRQKVTLVLDPATQRVNLVALGEPLVSESFFIPHSRAVDIVKTEMTTALELNGPTVRAAFSDARDSIISSLRTFEKTATVTFTQVEVTVDGVIVRGDLSGRPRLGPAVIIDETDQGQAFTAFESWIPGGRIDRYLWSWVEYPPLQLTPWSGVAKSVTETKRFILPRPPGVTELSQICLQIQGERTLSDGNIQSVTVGRVCIVSEPPIAWDAPSWLGPVTVPVWMPDLPEDARLRDGITGYVTVPSDRPREGLGQNALVFFPDWDSAQPLAPLGRAAEPIERVEASLSIFLIVPDGAFDVTRRELEARLKGLPPEITARLQLAEDTEDAWARSFDVSKRPALYLVDARREFVWSAVGEVAPEELAKALKQHLVPVRRAAFRPLSPRVASGARAPDIAFVDDSATDGALHRLSGRTVHLCFWQDWSAPSRAELQRLQALLSDSREEASRPVILAFHGGSTRGNFDRVRKKLGLTFSLVQDNEHRVARLYGVRCWPTTIVVSDGVIQEVRQGVERQYGESTTPGSVRSSGGMIGASS